MAERSTPSPLDFSRLPERGVVAGEGIIRSVTFVAPSESPRFTAMIEDTEAERPGRGPAIRLLWLGRRRIQGVDAGTSVRFSGMLSTVQGEPTIYNPRYEILAKEE